MIKYIGFFDDSSNPSSGVSPAAVSKMGYVISSLLKNNFSVRVVSLAFKENIKEVGRGFSREVDFVFVPFFSLPGKWLNKVFRLIWINIWLFFYFLINCKVGEVVLVYHSFWIIPSVFLASKIKRLKVCLEVEEFYTDVGRWPPFLKWLEIRFFKTFSVFIVPTLLIRDRVGSGDFYVASGSYKINFDKKYIKPNDKIRVLYAGIIDRQKRGAFNAIEAARYLDSSYEIHVAGFGDVDELLSCISDINSTSACKVYYDGLLTGEEFKDYCLGFHIGLSTQRVSGDYSSSSFPSKIFTYLSFGMQVVSPRINCVAGSAVADLINYYDNDDPASIAVCIKGIDPDFCEKITDRLLALDSSFCTDLKSIFSRS